MSNFVKWLDGAIEPIICISYFLYVVYNFLRSTNG